MENQTTIQRHYPAFAWVIRMKTGNIFLEIGAKNDTKLWFHSYLA
jgi:hypothetical protein